jgi:Domain of unknown function (DUF5680)
VTESIDEAELSRFLAAAKKSTYASQGDEASVAPAHPGSKQLEFSQGPFLYRDIYFGTRSFVGQEVVELRHRPIWSMSYAGGMTDSHVSDELVKGVYEFLREALSSVSEPVPVRGPPRLRREAFEYTCAVSGTLTRFQGSEVILVGGRPVYGLIFAGGTLY